MTRYAYNLQKQPPAPFVLVTLRNPSTGAEVRDVPAQLDTGGDPSLLPLPVAQALALSRTGHAAIGGVGGTIEQMDLYGVLLGINTLAPRPVEVLAHPGEPWVLLGRDVLNAHRLLLDGPGLALEIG
jgi:hypothetical protein